MRVSTQNTSERYQLELDALRPPPPHWLTAFHNAITALNSLWERPLLSSNKSRLTLWIILLAICGLRAFLGLVGTELFSHDPSLSLDGAWRMLNGQRPHVDFFSNLGVLTYFPTVIGLVLSRGTAQGFGYGQAVIALALGIWCYGLCRSRLLEVSTALLCLLVVTMAASPFSLGFSPLKLSSAMVYNRVGYAVIALILVEAVNARRNAASGGEFAGGVSTGAAITLLFFLKITYALAGVVFLAALIGVRVQKKQRWLGLLAGSAAISLIACIYFRFNLLPILHNLNTIGHARRTFVAWYIVDDILEHAGVLLAFGFASVLLLGVSDRWKAVTRVGTLTVVTCVFGSLIILANYEQTGFPLAAFVAVLILDQVASERNRYLEPEPDTFFSAYHGLQSVTILLAGTMIFIPILASAMSFGKGIYWKVAEAPEARKLDSPAMAGFVPEETWYTDLVNDGLMLLKANRAPGETVMCLDFSNPFPFATQSMPAEGGATALQYLSTFSASHKPAPEWLFGYADLVMVPKKYSDETLTESIPNLYGPYLKLHFNHVAESSKWDLYRRKDEKK